MLPGLYVHVPFCRSKCPYCGFYAIPSEAPIDRWLKGLEREIRLTKSCFSRFDTLYLGGGTPSVLSNGNLERVLALVFDHYALAPDAEITLEANPNDVTLDVAKFYRSLGINRITLGAQSLNDRTLKFLGRRHASKDVHCAMEHLRSAGFRNIGLDLMYGFTAKPMREWMNTLKKALSFQPEHLSCYQLSIEKKTVFERRSKEGAGILLPEKMAAAHFLATASYLENKGYIHYEVSNFALNETFKSRHNQKYWRHIPYLGLGPSAHGFDGKKRWWNVSSVKKYCRALGENRLPIEGTETLSESQLHLEALALGLRTRWGVDLKILAPGSKETLRMLQRQGLVKIDHKKVVPTRRGYLMADQMPLLLSS